jgi:hypothetical protein
MSYPPSFDSLMDRLEIRVKKGALMVLNYDKLEAIVRALIELVDVDEDWYRATYPDVAAGINAGTLASAKEHYVKFGYFEGRLPYDVAFDEAWYLANYQDVAADCKAGQISAKGHFLKYGYREGRMPLPPDR